MKIKKIILHIAFSLLLLIFIVGLPAAFNFDFFSGSDSVDTVSGASVKLPDQPSGEFIVLINRSLHDESLNDWISFFKDEDFVVIFDDINCIAAEGDTAGFQLAQRYQAQLPENQMKLRTENPALLISKVENGCIDAAVFSQEMAEALKLAPEEKMKGITVVKVTGGN